MRGRHSPLSSSRCRACRTAALRCCTRRRTCCCRRAPTSSGSRGSLRLGARRAGVADRGHRDLRRHVRFEVGRRPGRRSAERRQARAARSALRDGARHTPSGPRCCRSSASSARPRPWVRCSAARSWAGVLRLLGLLQQVSGRAHRRRRVDRAHGRERRAGAVRKTHRPACGCAAGRLAATDRRGAHSVRAFLAESSKFGGCFAGAAV